MKIKKVTVEFEINEKDNLDIEKLSNLLSSFNRKVDIKKDDTEVESVNNEENVENHLNMLREFKTGLTEKQMKVFDYFMNHPGNVTGNELKKQLPFLQSHGSLPGVFRASRRWQVMGGNKMDSPFVQVKWIREEGCGLYRGLTVDEVEWLKEE